MTFSLTIPTGNPVNPLKITTNIGEMLFILGANGSGKSSLMQAFVIANLNVTRRISAHRQTWIDSGSPGITGKDRVQAERNINAFEQSDIARYRDSRAAERTQLAIYDLIDSENARSRAIAQAVDQGDYTLVEELRKKESAFSVMNRMLRLSNLGITLSVQKNDEIVATRNGHKAYSIAKLSDGERNAILIAANVLTVPAGTLLLIDEPERHLHRSIISPFLSLMSLLKKPITLLPYFAGCDSATRRFHDGFGEA